jgi:DnaJ-class molecular chaperone
MGHRWFDSSLTQWHKESMMDLYKALDIDKSATKEQVKKAYRKKALKAHPDAGGDKESFALISLAHDVLTDDLRRERYDATGDTEEKKTNTVMETVSQMAKAAFDEDSLDPVVFMKRHTDKTIHSQRMEKKKAEDHIKKLEKKLEKKLAKFVKQNAKTKSTQAKMVVEKTINAAIESYRGFITQADASIELWESVHKFIEGLERGPVEEGQGFAFGGSTLYSGLRSSW